MFEGYLSQHPHAAWRIYDGEAVILGPDDSTLNTLNGVGTLIWEGADGRTRVSDIVAKICEQFDVDPARAERDSTAFMEELCRRRLLSVSATPKTEPRPGGHGGTPGESRQPIVGGPKGKRTYEPPEIQSQEVFETTALACGKLSGQGGPCVFRPRTS